jgi:hypothetical protein
MRAAASTLTSSHLATMGSVERGRAANDTSPRGLFLGHRAAGTSLRTLMDTPLTASTANSSVKPRTAELASVKVEGSNSPIASWSSLEGLAAPPRMACEEFSS